MFSEGKEKKNKATRPNAERRSSFYTLEKGERPWTVKQPSKLCYQQAIRSSSSQSTWYLQTNRPLLVDNTAAPQFRYLTHICFLSFLGGNFPWGGFQIPREDWSVSGLPLVIDPGALCMTFVIVCLFVLSDAEAILSTLLSGMFFLFLPICVDSNPDRSPGTSFLLAAQSSNYLWSLRLVMTADDLWCVGGPWFLMPPWVLKHLTIQKVCSSAPTWPSW